MVQDVHEEEESWLGTSERLQRVVKGTMSPPYVSGNRLVEEDEQVLLELVTVNQPVTDVNLGEEIPTSTTLSVLEVVTEQPKTLKPPVTRLLLVLMEEQVSPPSLEVCHELIFNPKVQLRMQSFRNFDGEKIHNEEAYWSVLSTELMKLSECNLNEGDLILLPELLEEIKKMLLYLYPDSKLLREQLLSDMDVPFLVEQIRLGNANAVSLALILGTILKANCAPKRDPLVEHMMRLGSDGNWIGMLRMCLELMELMKLDLLNYRMAQNRKIVLAGVIERERQHFANFFNKGLLNETPIKKWLWKVIEQDHSSYKGGDLTCVDAVREGLLELVMCRTWEGVPETFILDSGRIEELRGAAQDISILASALLLFKQWAGPSSMAINVQAEIKTRLAKVLAFQHARMNDLGTQLLLVASRVGGQPISGEARRLLYASVDHIIDPEHAVYRLLRSSLRGILRTYLKGQTVSDCTYRKAGLAPVKIEIEALLPRLKLLWTVNWKVHGSRYTAFLKNILDLEIGTNSR